MKEYAYRKGVSKDMAMSEAKKKANKKWNDENISKLYDRVSLLVPKGKKDEIKAFATKQGESVNSFINKAIDEKIERDGSAEG